MGGGGGLGSTCRRLTMSAVANLVVVASVAIVVPAIASAAPGPSSKTASSSDAPRAKPLVLPPKVTSFSATPTTLPQAGGSVTLSASVTGTTNCVFSSSPAVSGLPKTVSCTGGSASDSVTVPANTGSKAKTYTFNLSAVGSKTVKATPVKVTVAGPPAPSVTSFTASPPTLPQTGGSVTLSASVTGVSTCAFSSTPALSGLPKTVTCSSGSASTVVAVTANATLTTETYTFHLTAKAKKASVTATPAIVTVAGPPAPTAALTATPAVLASAGGTVKLTGTVKGASTCVFSATPPVTGLPKTVSCNSGAPSASVTLPANSTKDDETYTFSLSATGNGTTDATPVAVSVAPSSPPAEVDVSGTLSANTTWSPQLASAYVISNASLDVPAGITLTIAPGTVVKSIGIYDSSEPGVLSVQGTLDATGTSSDPVTFTSINDNTVGGDTGSGSPKAGDSTGSRSTTAVRSVSGTPPSSSQRSTSMPTPPDQCR